eukprot:1195356-Prorocentrum_minimum.AAC.6
MGAGSREISNVTILGVQTLINSVICPIRRGSPLSSSCVAASTTESRNVAVVSQEGCGLELARAQLSIAKRTVQVTPARTAG